MRSKLFRALAVVFTLCILLTACNNSTGQPTGGKPVIPASLSMNLVENTNNIWPTVDFETATPESQGIDSGALATAIETCIKKDKTFDSFLVMRHGKLVNESYRAPYTKDMPHTMYSVTKSVLSACVGIALQEGLIQSIDQKVLDFFPNVTLPQDLQYKESMTIRHLLTMTSGILGDERWDEFENAQDVGEAIFLLSQKKQPGEEFHYDSIATHLLSCVVTKATGNSLYDYAKEKLFDPLGMDSVTWWADKQGNSFGGFGISMTPRDMLRFGYLYLNNGRWEDKQILSADWVKATPPTTEGFGQYGFLFWTNSEELPENYECNGANGQHIIVFPKLDMVVVITADGYHNNKYLYKSINEGVKNSALSENMDAQARLVNINAEIAEEIYPDVQALLAKLQIKSETTIDFSTLVKQVKKKESVSYSIDEEGLHLRTEGESSGLVTADTYNYPLVVTMRVKSDSDEISPLIGLGKGYMQLYAYPQEKYGSIDIRDIRDKNSFTTYSGKGNAPLGEIFELEWILTNEFQAVLVDGALCTYSSKSPYLQKSETNKSTPLLFATGDSCELLIESIIISQLG